MLKVNASNPYIFLPLSIPSQDSIIDLTIIGDIQEKVQLLLKIQTITQLGREEPLDVCLKAKETLLEILTIVEQREKRDHSDWMSRFH